MTADATYGNVTCASGHVQSVRNSDLARSVRVRVETAVYQPQF